jgi:DNA polymerase epsilon subunit 3
MDPEPSPTEPSPETEAAPVVPTTEKKLPDFEPPQASVQRIVKAALPENCQITKESKAAFSKAAGIFILYLTSCSNDFCQENKRSTISSADIIAALKELDFQDMIGPLEEFLSLMRKESADKKKVGAAETTDDVDE